MPEHKMFLSLIIAATATGAKGSKPLQMNDPFQHNAICPGFIYWVCLEESHRGSYWQRAVKKKGRW